MILWVIGEGGLFGSAIVREAQGRGWTVFHGRPIPWNEPREAVRAIAEDARRFRDRIPPAERWGIVWAAGRATTASTEQESARELQVFEESILAVVQVLGDKPGGVFLLASSAGGIYAGSPSPPFTSHTQPSPTGTYGRLKLSQEQLAAKHFPSDMPVVIARLANLYGPGQDLNKLQGLVSKLALTSITQDTLIMFVPLDTLRDFIHADDAASRALHWLSVATSGVQTRVIGSGQATSLGYVIKQMRAVTRRPLPIAYGMHHTAAVQSPDLRLRPDEDEDISRMQLRSLPVGLKETFEDMLSRHQENMGMNGAG